VRLLAIRRLLEHWRSDFGDQTVAYLFTHTSGIGIIAYSAILYSPASPISEMQKAFVKKEYAIVRNQGETFLEGFVRFI
jgi:hypothetical protein